MADLLSARPSRATAIAHGSGEGLARKLPAARPPTVLCHGDLHRNCCSRSRTRHIVDWDTGIAAPQERDLMVVGSGMGGRGPDAQSPLVFSGYGPAGFDPA